MSDLEEKMAKGQIGEVVTGKEKWRSIMYADDVILLANRKADMREILKRFGRFIQRKGEVKNNDRESRSRTKKRDNGNGEKRKQKKLKEVKVSGSTLYRKMEGQKNI